MRDAVTTVRIDTSSLGCVSTAAWNGALDAVTGPICIVPGGTELNAVTAPRGDGVRLLVAESSALWPAWELLPPHLALLAVDPADCTAIVADAGRLRSATESDRTPFLWQWLLDECERDATAIELVVVEEPHSMVTRPELAPARPDSTRHWLRDLVAALSNGITVRAGLLQLHDFLEESHQLSQSIEGDPDGDYWHAIMHRREPDASNAKYWFRRVGSHPVQTKLASRVAAWSRDTASNLINGDDWDAFAFVDLCERARRESDPDLVTFCERVQLEEMLLLLAHVSGRS